LTTLRFVFSSSATWSDHFIQTLLYHAGAKVDEKLTKDSASGEEYVELVSHHAYSLHLEKEVESVTFVPFYFRANRGGKGQMRVGLRRYTDALKDSWKNYKS